MANRPKAWLAALLTFFFQPLGFLYVGRWRWAIAAVVIALGLSSLQFVFPYLPEWLASLMLLALMCGLARIAYVQALGFPPDAVRPAYSRWYGLLSLGLLFVLFMVSTRAFLFEPFSIPAGSMQPNLPVDSRLVVQKWGYGNYATFGVSLMRSPVSAPVERGDVFVFEFPPNRRTQYVKRIVGLPGDTIEYRNRTLSVNGRALSQRPVDDYFDPAGLRYYNQHMETLGKVEYKILLDKARPDFPHAPEAFAHSENCTYSAGGVKCLVPKDHYYVLGDNRDNSLDSRYWGFVPSDHLVGKFFQVFPPR
ncbi:MAG: signal peptidase I [Burkholderiales bacterium PBB3]|nr:MAG: signal peptidase I [Burkholderiales bacterium PBB3]